MSKILFLIIVVGLAVALGLTLHQDPGYVLIALDTTSVEMPLWLAAVAIITTVIVGYLCFYLLGKLLAVGSICSKHLQQLRQKRSRQWTDQGLIALAEGHWLQAERYLLKAAQYSDFPLLIYLSAAHAAQELGEQSRRDEYLRLAHENTSGTDIAVGITQAQLQFKDHQLEQCLATLKHLHSLAPKHPFVLKLLKNVYLKLEDWQALEQLLPSLQRSKVINKEQALVLNKQIFMGLFQHALVHNNLDKANQLWHQADKAIVSDVQLIKRYTELLLTFDQHNAAEDLLRHSLKQQWCEDLILAYGLTHSDHLEKQISTAESWLKRQPQNPNLLLTLGRLCIAKQLWGKAKDYLQSSLNLAPNVECYAVLANLLEQLNEPEKSAELYRQGLLKAAALDPQTKEAKAKVISLEDLKQQTGK